MTGLAALVPLAELLAEMAGSRDGATVLAIDIFGAGTAALVPAQDDLHVATCNELVVAGVTFGDGSPRHGRAAELVTVCEILASVTPPSPALPAEPRLVLAVPPDTVPLADGERLASFVLDVIRRATSTLAIGGAFWNDAGFELLDEVLIPALRHRDIATTIYVNTPVLEHRDALDARLDSLVATGPVTVRWFVGPRPTMLHAKFVIRDRSHGYLGTANLTSWGLHGHVEAGVELTVGQSGRFVRFLEELDAAGLFADAPPRQG